MPVLSAQQEESAQQQHPKSIIEVLERRLLVQSVNWAWVIRSRRKQAHLVPNKVLITCIVSHLLSESRA